jgi:hypothetical protein
MLPGALEGEEVGFLGRIPEIAPFSVLMLVSRTKASDTAILANNMDGTTSMNNMGVAVMRTA